MTQPEDAEKPDQNMAPDGVPVVVIKARDVAVYVPQKRSSKTDRETGAVWPETMTCSKVNQFGADIGTHNCSPVLLKNKAGQAIVNRYFFGLEKEDFGRNQLFEIAVMEQKTTDGNSIHYLDLRKTGSIDEKTQPRMKLKIISIEEDIAASLPAKYSSEKSVLHRNGPAGFFTTPPGHPVWAVKIPQCPSSFVVLWSCRQPSRKKTPGK